MTSKLPRPRRRLFGTTNSVLLRGLALLAIVLAVPATASAQFGMAFGFRDVNGEETDAANSDRRGYELRAFWDRQLNPVFGWRLDLGAVQMQYQREVDALRRQVSESGVEAVFAARASRRSGALAGTYVTAGPLVSARVSCGVLGGFVECDETQSLRAGAALSLGYAQQLTQNRDVLIELRYVLNSVAGVGRPVVALAIGMQGRRGR